MYNWDICKRGHGFQGISNLKVGLFISVNRCCVQRLYSCKRFGPANTSFLKLWLVEHGSELCTCSPDVCALATLFSSRSLSQQSGERSLYKNRLLAKVPSCRDGVGLCHFSLFIPSSQLFQGVKCDPLRYGFILQTQSQHVFKAQSGFETHRTEQCEGKRD